MPGRKLELKLYIEGIEVPCPGAIIQIATNQASICSLTLIPTLKISRIRPKSHIHLFWYDDVSGRWGLLWEGEVLGYSFSKTPLGRSVQLECADLTNYWDYTLKCTTDGYLGNMRSVDEEMFFGDRKAVVSIDPSVGAVTSSKVWMALNKYAQKGGLPRALYEVMQTITKDIVYYKQFNNRIKLSEQINLAPDLQSEQFLKLKEQMQFVLMQIEGRNSQMTTLREMWAGFCSFMQYDCVSLGAPSMVTAWDLNALGSDSASIAIASKTTTPVLKSVVLKPNLFGCIPPKCNVILPDICTNITFNRNFMTEPTRLWMRTNEMFANVTDLTNKIMTYFAPAAMFDKYQNNAKLTSKKIFFETFSDEEMEKGILPQVTMLPFAEMSVIRSRNQALFTQAEGQTQSSTAIRSATQKLAATLRPLLVRQAEYQFQLSRHASRGMSVTMEFNPWLVCGFPCFVADASLSFFGNIESITHSIDAVNGGTTMIQCSLVREAGDPANDSTPTIPEWTSNLYQPDQISDTYQRLLGCKAMCDDVPVEMDVESHLESGLASEATLINMSALALGLYNPNDRKHSRYHQAVDANAAYAFADGYRRRSIATIEDVQKFYGLRPEGPGNPPKRFSGELFDYTIPATAGVEQVNYPKNIDGSRIISGPNHKQKIIIDYVNELKQSQVLDGR
jgi:hypothetical protein